MRSWYNMQMKKASARPAGGRVTCPLCGNQVAWPVFREGTLENVLLPLLLLRPVCCAHCRERLYVFITGAVVHAYTFRAALRLVALATGVGVGLWILLHFVGGPGQILSQPAPYDPAPFDPR